MYGVICGDLSVCAFVCVQGAPLNNLTFWETVHILVKVSSSHRYYTQQFASLA